MSQLIIGYTTEGTTDIRFLESIIQRTFELVGFECTQSVEILPLISIPKNSGSFVEQILQASANAYKQGVMVFNVHVDADANTDKIVMDNKITPLIKEIQNHRKNDICRTLISIIPIHMSEAWMLADIPLLKAEIGTDLNNIDLGLTRPPETIADPKNTIEEAIRIARQNLVRRRRNELYM